MAKFLSFTNCDIYNLPVALNVEDIRNVETMEVLNVKTNEKTFLAVIKTFKDERYVYPLNVGCLLNDIEHLTEI